MRESFFILEPAAVKNRTLPAQRFSGLAHIAAMQYQPVVGIHEKFSGDALEQFVLHRQRRRAGR